MQTIQFIETVQWLKSQFSDEVNAFLSGRIGPERIPLQEFVKVASPTILIDLSHELARKQPELQAHP